MTSQDKLAVERVGTPWVEKQGVRRTGLKTDESGIEGWTKEEKWR